MAESAVYASFIVRLWREVAAEAADQEYPVWLGELESIQTGRAWQFQGLELLLDLLAAQLGDRKDDLGQVAPRPRIENKNAMQQSLPIPSHEEKSDMIEFHTVDLNEVQIHYAEAPAPGPALLLVHGATGSHTTYLPFLPELAQHAHVYALDLRGHGLSGHSHTPGAYRLADYGRDVAAFLRTVVGKPAILAGHSLGGYVALWVAAENPDLVARLFLEDPPLYLTDLARFHGTIFHGFFAALAAHLPVHHARGGTVEDMAAYMGQMPANEEQTMLDVAGLEWVHMRGVDLHQLDPAMLQPALNGDLLGPYAPDALLAQVRCPVQLLSAQYELGGAMSSQDVARTVAHLTHCKHTAFAGVGHGIHEERPTEYLQALKQFITQDGGIP